MEIPDVPARITSLVTSGKLPPDLAALFAPDGEPATCWEDVAEGVDEYLAGVVDDDVRGAVELAGAYGHLDPLEHLGSAQEMTEHNDRAEALLHAAEEHGVEYDETAELWTYSDRMRNLAVDVAETQEYIAEHGALAPQRLDAKLGQAHALYEAGDRAAALPLFREVAEADLWGEFSGAGNQSDIGWCRLLHDAAHVEGPEATRRIWQEAVASRHAARFPDPDLSCKLIELLLGTGVPDILRALVEGRLDAAEDEQPSGLLPRPLDEDERRVLGLALDEVEQHLRTHPPREAAGQPESRDFAHGLVRLREPVLRR